MLITRIVVIIQQTIILNQIIKGVFYSSAICESQ